MMEFVNRLGNQKKYQKEISSDRSHGFTLTEILVVITIIGILSAAIFVGVQSSRQKAMDAKREALGAQLQNALDNFYLDHGFYPPSYYRYTNSSGGTFSDGGSTIVANVLAGGVVEASPGTGGDNRLSYSENGVTDNGQNINCADCKLIFDALTHTSFGIVPQYANVLPVDPYRGSSNPQEIEDNFGYIAPYREAYGINNAETAARQRKPQDYAVFVYTKGKTRNTYQCKQLDGSWGSLSSCASDTVYVSRFSSN